MATIQKTVEIPSDHRLRLDLAVPEDIPAGTAEVVVTISPVKKTMTLETVRAFAGILADSKPFGHDGVTAQREMRDEWR